MSNSEYFKVRKKSPIKIHNHTANTKPLVTIACITFNHEKYIRETLESFLMQKTSFPVEIIVHDDASTDNTSKIVKDYEVNFPHLFRNIYQTENQYSKGKSMFAGFVFPKARGKYIALCEGDDYWTDPLKLQKQVEFLEENEEYILSFHPWVELYEGQFKKPASMFSSTHTLLFKNIDLNRPKLLSNALNGDTILKFMLKHHGKFKYLEGIKPAVKRRDSEGVWNSLSDDEKRKNKIKTSKLMYYGFKDSKYEKEANLKYVKTATRKQSKILLDKNELRLIFEFIKKRLLGEYISIRYLDLKSYIKKRFIS